MKLLRLTIGTDFRSLDAGFTLSFRAQPESEELLQFQPFCFAGLNGSGKSNVLEALANIFYHLELCANRYKPEGFKHFFTPAHHPNGPDAFEVEYLITPKDASGLETGYNHIRITKEVGSPPKMWQRFVRPDKEGVEKEMEIVAKSNEKSAEGKGFLPELVVGYSSGENEILSIPFLKSRLIRLDEHAQLASQGGTWKESAHSLAYIDAEMSQAVLMACLLFEEDKTLEPLHEELGIRQLRSFRMHLNNHRLKKAFEGDKKTQLTYPVFDYIKPILDKLKVISTSFYEEERTEEEGYVKGESYLLLDFYVDDIMKKAFRKIFNNSALACFRFFQHLYELNNHFVEQETKEEVYESKGKYTHGKLQLPGPDQKVFYFLDFLIDKRIKEAPAEYKDLLLRDFSDGEHQFLHTMGICLLLKDRRTLMLLDEPETHFNPDWRSKFIRVLSDSIKAGGGNNLLKDVVLTSHSPFIISDCFPNNVFVFKRDNNKVTARSAKDMEFNTYGAGVDLVLQEVFGVQHSISEQALEEIRLLLEKEDINEIIHGAKHLSESYEKGFLWERVAQLREKNKGT
jgi:restriction system-associated AAA family ATPase